MIFLKFINFFNYFRISFIKDINDKNKDIIEKIKEIYYTNKGRYGYKRVTLELKIKI